MSKLIQQAWFTDTAPGAGSIAIATPSAPPIVDAWSTTYGSPSYYTLSNSNLTIKVAAGGANLIVTNIGSVRRLSGRWYFELSFANSGQSMAYGLATAAFSATKAPGGDSPGPNQSVGWGNAFGYFSYNNVGTLSGLVGVSGHTYGFAWDLDLGNGYIRDTLTPTTWYGGDDAGNADPELQLNPYTFTPIVSPVFICYSSIDNGSGNNTLATMNSAGPFAYPAPAGYTAWQG